MRNLSEREKMETSVTGPLGKYANAMTKTKEHFERLGLEVSNLDPSRLGIADASTGRHSTQVIKRSRSGQIWPQADATA